MVRFCNSEAHSIIMLSRFKRCHNSEALLIRFNCITLELSFKLVRVLDHYLIECPSFPCEILSFIHLRYLALCFYPRLQQHPRSKYAVPSSLIDLPLSISSLCYLQTLILYSLFPNDLTEYPFILPWEILTMPQLRKLCLGGNHLRNHEPTENNLV